MRRLIGVLIALLLAAGTLVAQTAFIAFEQITVAAAAIGFTTTKINPTGQTQALRASCRLETAEIRWTIDGTTPTTTVGVLLEPGDVLAVTGNDNLTRFRAIRTGAASGILSCTYSAP